MKDSVKQFLAARGVGIEVVEVQVPKQQPGTSALPFAMAKQASRAATWKARTPTWKGRITQAEGEALIAAGAKIVPQIG
jgi:hypothetical protein